MKKLSVFLALLLAATVLVSCTGAKTNTGPNGNSAKTGLIEPEQLISKAEAAQLLGEVVKDGEKSEKAAVGQKTVFYAPANESAKNYIQISLTQSAFLNSTSNTPQSIYATMKENLKDASKTMKVDGIGSEYFFGTSGLHVLCNGYYISIMAGNSGKTEVQALMGEAAKTACRNLAQLLK
jgi:hypothetical protein